MTTEGPKFLKEKYTLQNSPEVGAAAKRTQRRTGEKLPQKTSADAEARIQNYLDRLRNVIYPQKLEGSPNFDRQQRNLEMLKRALYDRFVIKPEEVPQSYFDSIVRRHREEGYGDIKIPEEQKAELIEPIINDQRNSLDNWVDYFASPDAKYPDHLKYWAFRSMLKMGRYDKEKKKFTERYGGAVSPFPELNREALALVLNAVEKKHRGQQIDFGYDITADVKENFLRLLDKENFAKLYAVAIEEFKPISEELLKVTEGKWVKYPKGTDAIAVVESLKHYGTGWCIRGESTARRYLQDNDLEIYYSLDQNNQPAVPRVVIVRSDKRTSEVRGVAKQENLDPYIGPVVEAKLRELPDGKLYMKKHKDMELLTTIDRKVTAGEELSKEDLIFIYEINIPIEGFGYKRDPRIAELRKGRDVEADKLVVLEATNDQIAHTVTEINSSTRAYIGKIEPGVFDSLPNTEHIYTSFPEGKIRSVTLNIGGKTGEELEREMEGQGIVVHPEAKAVLRSRNFIPLKNPEETTLVMVPAKDLGFSGGEDIRKIYQGAEKFGLEICSADTGPHCILQEIYQRGDRGWYTAMEGVEGSGGERYVFGMGTPMVSLSSQPWLVIRGIRPKETWLMGQRLVFRVRKKNLTT